MIEAGELRSGSVIAGRFRLDKRLSAWGGQGTVWAATQLSDGAKVAVKVMRPDDTGKALKAVNVESKALKQISSNEHIAGFIDSGVADGIHYVASRLVRGEDLETTRRRSGGKLSDRDLRRAAYGSLCALQACHRANVVHRDVKPPNLILDLDSGAVVLVDFGISVSLIASTQPHNGYTARFMGPEFAAPKPPPEYDIFCWGTTMVHLATGHFPFCDDVAEESVLESMVLAVRASTLDPDLRGVPAWLLPLVRAAFAPVPSQRPNAATLLAMLDTTRDGSVRRPEPDMFARMAPRPVAWRVPQWAHEAAKHPTAVMVAAAVGLVVWRFVDGPTGWAAFAGLTVTAAGIIAIVHPPPVFATVRRSFRAYTRRWIPRWGSSPHRWRVPAGEFAAACAAAGYVASRTVLAPMPDTPGGRRAVAVAAVGVALLAAHRVRWARVAPLRADGFVSRIAVPLVCVTFPVVAAQLRSLDVTHLSVATRLVPWWALFAASVLVALWGGLGSVSVRSDAFHAVTVGASAAAGAATIGWAAMFHPLPDATAWQLFTTEVRVVLVTAAGCAVAPVLTVRLPGWWRRLAVTVALPAATVTVAVACWWTRWLTWPDAWIEFHLWSRFTPRPP